MELVEKPNPVTSEWKESEAKARRTFVDRISSEQLLLVMGLTQVKKMLDELDTVYLRKNTLVFTYKTKIVIVNFQ